MADLVAHAQKAIDDAYANVSKLSNDILRVDGMSGNKTRHLYNNMCSMPDARYLEIGTYKGSTLISSLYKNDHAVGYGVDNWSEFGGCGELWDNLKRNLPDHSPVIIDKDCWTVTAEDLPITFNVFLYDGAHSYESQKRGITYFTPFLADEAIVMVDDWMCDWVGVKRGTMDGIAEAGLEVVWSKEIPLVNTTNFHMGGDTFWNGCGVFVVRKTK
jgi:hypothetical protein